MLVQLQGRWAHIQALTRHQMLRWAGCNPCYVMHGSGMPHRQAKLTKLGGQVIWLRWCM